MLKKYCKRLDLVNILFYLSITTSRNINLSLLTQYFIAIQFLSNQPDLKLILCLLKTKNNILDSIRSVKNAKFLQKLFTNFSFYQL